MQASEGLAAIVGAAAGAAVAAAVVESRPSPALVAVGAAAGGFGGLLLWRIAGSTGRAAAGREAAALLRAAEERALCQVDQIHEKQSKRATQDGVGPCDLSYCRQVEEWVFKLLNEPKELSSPALRLAARSQHLRRHAQEGRLEDFFCASGIEPSVASRAARLVAKDDLLLARDREMQTLEDAVCLVGLGRSSSSGVETNMLGPVSPADENQTKDRIRKLWRRMSPYAQATAASFTFSPHVLGCFLQAIATEEGLEVTMSPMVAPRLPSAVVALLRESWKLVPKEKFGKDFFQRLYTEDPRLKEVFDYPIARPENVPKVVEMLLDLLDTEQVPRLERIAHAMAALGMKFGRLRTKHFGAIKRALSQSVYACAKAGEKKKCNQAWEALFYSLFAVVGPCLLMGDSPVEIAASTSAALPTPGGGTHAGMIAANGTALLEKCLGITAISQNGTAAPDEVVAKLREAKEWLLQAVKDEMHAHCGLMCCVIAHVTVAKAAPTAASSASNSAAGGPRPPLAQWEEAERRLWQNRAIEVPLKVAEYCTGVASVCLGARRHLKKSLYPDWLAGAKLLRTATEISLRAAQLNLHESRSRTQVSDGLEKRFAKLRDAEPPWEDLCDMPL